jgi:hypothetical protein
MSTMIGKKGPPIGMLHEVRAAFGDPEAMQQAVDRLETSGFDRADLSLPEVMPSTQRATPEAGAKPVDTEPDARQARTLHVSGVTSVAALMAAALVIAWGAPTVWAVAAAIIGGAIAGIVLHLLSSAANQREQTDRERKAATGTLILSVRVPNAEKRAQAGTILRAAGGREIEVQ